MPKQSQYRLTGQIPEIDIRRWRKSGHLAPGMRFISQWFEGAEPYAGMRVHVESHRRLWLSYHYEQHGIAEDLLYPITIDWTDCHLGGHRPWFSCPNPDCGRRCAILYAERVFRCRECLELRYPSQREPRYDRSARRAENIRHRLGWTPGMLAGPEWKPKHMHWRTFQRLVDEHERFAEAAVNSAVPLQKLAAAVTC
jgi:hypothetical protein